MNKKQAETLFKKCYLPFVPKNDKPALRMEWNNFTDMLCKDGQITSRQYATWVNPRFVK